MCGRRATIPDLPDRGGGTTARGAETEDRGQTTWVTSSDYGGSRLQDGLETRHLTAYLLYGQGR